MDNALQRLMTNQPQVIQKPPRNNLGLTGWVVATFAGTWEIWKSCHETPTL
jgi:hypothetical protein